MAGEWCYDACPFMRLRCLRPPGHAGLHHAFSLAGDPVKWWVDGNGGRNMVITNGVMPMAVDHRDWWGRLPYQRIVSEARALAAARKQQEEAACARRSEKPGETTSGPDDATDSRPAKPDAT